MQIRIRLTSISDVKEFVDINNKYIFDINAHSEKFVVDAKSILGMFSLDLSKELYVRAKGKNVAEYKQIYEYIKEIKKFVLTEEK